MFLTGEGAVHSILVLVRTGVASRCKVGDPAFPGNAGEVDLMRKQVVFFGMLAVGIPLGLGTGCDLVQGLKPATLVETGGGGQGGAGGSTTTGGTGGTTSSLFCEPGTSIPCYTGPAGTEGVAMCKGGMRACKADGSGHEDTCEGEVLPKAETCASTGDEDCDQLDCVRWAAVYGDEYEQVPLDIATDQEGNTYVLGAFEGSLGLVDPPLVSAGEHDLFLARIDPSGNVVWARRFGNAGDQKIAKMSVDSDGNVLIAGSFEGTLSFGGQELLAQGFDVFVAKLDSSGGHLWSKRYGDGASQSVSAVRVDPEKNVFLIGAYRGILDFGSGPMTATCCDLDIYIAKLDADGTALWGKSFGDAAAQYVGSAAADSSGSLAICGSLSGSMDLGGGDLVASGNASVYVARFDGGGGYGWANKYVGDSLVLGAFGSDEGGNLTLFGALAGSVDFGGGFMPSDGSGLDLFLTKMTSTGFHQWSKVLPTTGVSNFAAGVAADGEGNWAITSWGSGTVDFGGGALGAANQDSVYLAKLSSDGEHIWSRRIPGRLGVVATAPNGDIVLAAKVSGTIDVGTGPLVTKGQDLLIARFAP